MKKMSYPYNADESVKYEQYKQPITQKQLNYILILSEEMNDKDETLNSIMDSIDSELDIEDLTKGQASFVIRCLLGEIKPISVEKEK